MSSPWRYDRVMVQPGFNPEVNEAHLIVGLCARFGLHTMLCGHWSKVEQRDWPVNSYRTGYRGRTR